MSETNKLADSMDHGQWGWRLDVSASMPQSQKSAPWVRAFQEMTDIEAGKRVNDSEQQQVGHFWIRAPEHAPTMGQATDIGNTLSHLADWIQAARDGDILLEQAHPITDVIHIGLGGSSLGAQLLVSATGTPDGMKIHFADNLDIHSLHHLVNRLRDRLANTLLIVASKSGSTRETLLIADKLFELFRAAGHPPEPRAVAITRPDSPLAERVNKEKWLASFPFWAWLGGRFSSISPTGLLSAGLAGAEIQSILAGARAMDDWTRQDDLENNPAAKLAELWYQLGDGQGERNLAVIPYTDRLEPLGRLLQQLLMESIGKRHNRQGETVEQGLTVYGNKGSSDQHALLQQLLNGRNDTIVFLVQVLDAGEFHTTTDFEVEDTLQHFLMGTRRALQDRHRPVITFTMPRLDPGSVGAIIAMLERAVGYYGALLHVNTYDQPAVESTKLAAKKFAVLQAKLLESLRGRARTLHELCQMLNADPVEVEILLARLVLTQRVARDGEGNTSSYRWTP